MWTAEHLSDAQDGVWFRVFPAESYQYQVAWPEASSSNGWLVLDRNHNGTIDDFGELFGNETPQPPPPPGQKPNGFLALAMFNTTAAGGNGDRIISEADLIYGQLRIWQDANHDGISQPEELHTLSSVGIKSISLDYGIVKRVDEYGNIFWYRGAIRDEADSEASKIIYDVYLENPDPAPPLSMRAAMAAGSTWNRLPT